MGKLSIIVRLNSSFSHLPPQSLHCLSVLFRVWGKRKAHIPTKVKILRLDPFLSAFYIAFAQVGNELKRP